MKLMSTSLGPTALIVDDNVFNRDICRIVLENLGYRIVEAADGGEALKFLRQQSPQLILLDLQMPVIDGTSLLRLIPASLNIPVIIMTAYPSWVNPFITET